ncbi:MAG TPA: DUF4232 domain-containing protein [Streptosporangiaceae bacterium]|nr:DUF4232 domain-containing protein [Streptosporangiaceae bacterium]
MSLKIAFAAVTAGVSIAALAGFSTTAMASTTHAAKAPAECTASQLKVAYTNNWQIREGALDGMSKTDNVVTFTNKSHSTCVIQGYPGVADLNSRGHQIQQAARSGAAVHPVWLKPGAVASSLITANTASCNRPTGVAGLLVTAPDQRTSTHLSSPGYMCLHSLVVNPVAAGNAGGLHL